MCGIVGILDTRGARRIDPDVLARMNESQHHRGPDDSGVHFGPGIGLGHRRLSIIDLATGHQPLYNEDDSVVVVFNGEIYNYAELIPELKALGHVFRTRSDTEVIVHAWEAWGEACVHRFRGMFAFALWDQSKRTLFLARDRLGVKPLYYALLPDGMLLFGSELKSLITHGGLDRKLDPFAVEEYFALGYVPEPRTIFSEAQKLPPAHTLTVCQGHGFPQPSRYWDLRFSVDARLTEQDACEELVRRLRESVRLRMISDVPLGAFLSGGVDSSAVVATMAGLSDAPVNTCSISFSHSEFDESQYAQRIADQFQTRHFVDQVDSDDFGMLDQLAGIYDEPFADSSALPTYRVCELARRHVTVALSGDGGDETFAGYGRYRTFLADQSWRNAIPEAVRHGVLPFLARLYPKLPRAPRFLRAKASLEAITRDPVAAYFHEVSVVRDADRRGLFSRSFASSLGGYSALQLFRAHAARAQSDDPLALIQYLDVNTYLVGDINTKVDRASMAHSLEVREPLMDHPLMEWMASLPSSLKIRGDKGKYLLKQALQPVLPADILHRRKMGFAVPLAAWFRGPLRGRISKLAESEALLDSGIFESSAIRSMVEQHQAGLRDHSAAMWSILMFDAFVRRTAGVAEQPSQKRLPPAIWRHAVKVA